MLAILVKFCQIFFSLPYEKTRNIWVKLLINKQEGKKFQINKQTSLKKYEHFGTKVQNLRL